jgi:predicted HTH transcriptional regulator
VSSFEMIRDRVAGLAPLPLKYPFAIIGLSDEPTSSSPQVQELTSELDQFLLDTVGHTLGEMALLTERPNYDFKLQLPQNRTTAKEICALANLPNGGVVLLGVDNAGRIRGIDRVELDEIQLRIENISRDSCRPRPTVSFHVFDALSDPNRRVLVARIGKVDRKPCMTSDRVYIRAGSSARPADTDEIRRLVLSGEV